MIPQLQSLRGLFAIMIFLHHIPYGGKGVFGAGGDAGVAFFFILSGFVLSMADSRRPIFEPRKWLVGRLKRIYPLNWLCLALFFVVVPDAQFFSRLPVHLLDIFLLQSYIPLASVYFSGNSVAWFLCDIMFCYVAFIWLRRLLRAGVRSRIIAGLAIAVCYVFVFVAVPSRMVTALLYVFPPTRVVDFAIGVLLYSAWRDSLGARVGRMLPIWRNAAEAGAIIVAVIAIAAWGYAPERLQVASMWWLPWCCVVAVFSSGNTGIIGRMLSARWLVWLGGISFPFYMTHYISIAVFRNIFADTGMGFVWLFISSFGVTLICSVLISRTLRADSPIFFKFRGRRL